MKVASKQRNRRNRKLARKKKSDPHQAKSRLRKVRRTRIRGEKIARALRCLLDARPLAGRPFICDGEMLPGAGCTLTRAGGAAAPATERARRITRRAGRGTP